MPINTLIVPSILRESASVFVLPVPRVALIESVNVHTGNPATCRNHSLAKYLLIIHIFEKGHMKKNISERGDTSFWRGTQTSGLLISCSHLSVLPLAHLLYYFSSHNWRKVNINQAKMTNLQWLSCSVWWTWLGTFAITKTSKKMFSHETECLLKNKEIKKKQHTKHRTKQFIFKYVCNTAKPAGRFQTQRRKMLLQHPC